MNDVPVWSRTKVIIAIASVAAVIAVVLAGSALRVDEDLQEQAISAIKWIAGFLLGGHVASDVASMVAGQQGGRSVENSENH